MQVAHKHNPRGGSVQLEGPSEKSEACDLLQFAYVIRWMVKKKVNIKERSLFRLIFHLSRLAEVTDNDWVQSQCLMMIGALTNSNSDALNEAALKTMATYYGYPKLFDA